MSIRLRAILFLSLLFALALLVGRTMGCLQSVVCKPRVRRENIVVYEVSASIDRSPTVVEENSPIVLRYRTPYFRASAGIVMPPVPRNETWTVGWIQACTQMEFYNTYGEAGVWVTTMTQNATTIIKNTNLNIIIIMVTITVKTIVGENWDDWNGGRIKKFSNKAFTI